MLLTHKLKLLPNEEQKNALMEVVERFNGACNFVAAAAFRIRSANKIRLQKEVYYAVRERYGLPAQMAIRAIAKVCEAYKRDKGRKPQFNKYGAVVYDQRILSWKGHDLVSLVTLSGRTVIPFLSCDHYEARNGIIRGQADLIFKNRVFYLCVAVEVPESETIEPIDALGVDLGIVNLAVDSDGGTRSGVEACKFRGRVAKLRSGLQSCGTRSAKRHLKKLSGKEKRFQRDINHCISKHIVAKAKDTKRSIVLEDLGGVRSQETVNKAQRRDLNTWGFFQLRSFIEYKAKLAGVPVVFVDPKNTSRICPRCGHVYKENRKTRGDFECVRCGFAGPADHVAATNIAARGRVNGPIVTGDLFGPMDHLGRKPTNSFVSG
ncbi:MAG: transposase [Methanomassiliicoccus sp.]|nr:transposase [Methanomassiliicoccus sp.]